jgi:hypothetical protein
MTWDQLSVIFFLQRVKTAPNGFENLAYLTHINEIAKLRFQPARNFVLNQGKIAEIVSFCVVLL